jgi:serine protease AprX
VRVVGDERRTEHPFISRGSGAAGRHEREKEAAAQAASDGAITDSEWTDGYLIGVVEEAEIPELMKQGLVIAPIEILEKADDASAQQPSRSVRSVSLLARKQGARPLGKSVIGKSSGAKIRSVIGPSPQFYVVRLNGPLTEERRAKLSDKRVSLLERLSNNTYSARLVGDEVNKLADEPFVDSIRLYSEEDTLSTTRSAPLGVSRAAGAGSPNFTVVHAVRLHRAEDADAVVNWLQRRLNVSPLWKKGDLLRVALPHGDQKSPNWPNCRRSRASKRFICRGRLTTWRVASCVSKPRASRSAWRARARSSASLTRD